MIFFNKSLTAIRTIALAGWPRHTLKLGLVAGSQFVARIFGSDVWPAPARDIPEPKSILFDRPTPNLGTSDG